MFENLVIGTNGWQFIRWYRAELAKHILNTTQARPGQGQAIADIFSFPTQPMLVSSVIGRVTSMEIFQDKAFSSEFILFTVIALTRPPSPQLTLGSGKMENIWKKWKYERLISFHN